LSWTLREKYRAILARETGYYQKVWGKALNVCLAYPHAYRTGMSNLGFQTVYDLFNRHPSGRCERVFLPDPEQEAEFLKLEMPLFSLESQRPLTDFDVVAFSLSFENDFPNILKMLEMSGIPLLSQDRAEQMPLVLGGGIAATLNPEPLADFFDLFMLGEGEEVIGPFIELCGAAPGNGLTKGELLICLQKEVPGVYVPRFYQVSYGEDNQITGRLPVVKGLPEKIKAARLRDINSCSTEQRITAADTELGNMSLVEVSRGCGHGCRFCAAGFLRRPVRFRRAELLQASFIKALEGRRKIGLLGTAVSDHPDLLAMCRFIRERGGKVAIGSLRLDKLKPELIKLLKESGTETVALAPEAGSQRLRDLMGKGFQEDDIFRAVTMLGQEGITNLRLYFMAGLPTEEEEDITALIELTKKIREVAEEHSRGGRPQRLTLSINQFIPKAATPWQWQPLADTGLVKKRVKRVVEAFRREASVRVIHDQPKWNYVQTLLSLGDRRVGKILLDLHQCGGNWPQALKASDLNPDFFVYRPKDHAEIMPWDFIETGVSKSFLLTEAEG
jgi:radical SAM superfamily enzyme YgiQ (UPF0313 family)